MDTSSFPVPDDVRFGELIKAENGKVSEHFGDLVLVGFPFDIGVARNNGRIGASQGPASLRRLNKRVGTMINAEYGVDLWKLKVSDSGDIDPSQCKTLEEAHAKLRERVVGILKEGKVPFIVGGGNDQSYPNGAALLDIVPDGNVGVVNIDAHLDVRPLKDGLAHSGSPFRQLLEDSRFKGRFIEFACQGHQCSSVHAQYVKDKGGMLIWLSDLRKESVTERFQQILDVLEENIFVSFDIDSICGADCPGVSAPGVVGLTAQEALEMCYIAGKHPKVRLVDLSEYNPVIEEYRTGKLVASMFYFFAMGLAQRKAGGKHNAHKL